MQTALAFGNRKVPRLGCERVYTWKKKLAQVKPEDGKHFILGARTLWLLKLVFCGLDSFFLTTLLRAILLCRHSQ